MTPETAIGIIDVCFAIMAVRTLIATIWLAPPGTHATRRYWHITPELQSNAG